MSIVLHIPHSSKCIPTKYLKFFTLPNLELQIELLKMTDHFTDELFDVTNSNIQQMLFPLSRLLVDVERFESDELEIMSKVGMGCIYEKTHDGKDLKIVKDIKDELIKKFYKKHHVNFNEIVSNQLIENNKVLIIDCHSFPKYPLPYELNQDKNRPEICIGCDDFHTSEKLKNLFGKFFKEFNFIIKFNNPFKGSIVPEKYYYKDRRVQSVMIEIRRDLYMDEQTGNKSIKFNEIKNTIRKVIMKTCNYA